MFLCWFMFSWLFTFPVALHRFMHIQLALITSSTFSHVFQALYIDFLKEGSSLARESGSGWALEHCIAPVLVKKGNKYEATWQHCVQRGVVCHPLRHLVSISTIAWSFMVKVEGCLWCFKGVFSLSIVSIFSDKGLRQVVGVACNLQVFMCLQTFWRSNKLWHQKQFSFEPSSLITQFLHHSCQLS